MNLGKHDPETEMEMNMTPMIDVVFLLIIFFMIITDMTQQDLEELTLPMAVKAVEDKPKPGDNRPIINIPHDGRMIIKREEYYNPESDKGDYSEVKKWLTIAADAMEKEFMNEETQSGPKIPGDALLLRADQSTPFRELQKVMELCGDQTIQIWKVQLAASRPEEDDQ